MAPAGHESCQLHQTRVSERSMDITHYFDMGKYGAYVWSSYALSALVLLGNLMVALRAHRSEYRRAWRRLERGG